MKKKTNMDRPKYIIKVHRSWRYGPRARFWEIQTWHDRPGGTNGGYWGSACKGGLAYTEFGMWRAINKRLKKMQFGFVDNYYNLDRTPIKEPK